METKQKVFIKATRSIAPGEEILIDYGFDYWLFFYQQCHSRLDHIN
jgi:SET domain-containing protein